MARQGENLPEYRRRDELPISFSGVLETTRQPQPVRKNGFRLNGKLIVDELSIPKKNKYLMKDVCEALGINEKTYRTWEKKDGSPKPEEIGEDGYSTRKR